ncbi:MAG TPA: benzoate-CoA ligase family protein [Steroidobacteraceae bacterium]|nr:benzoate-CoA ligase family protein [Steroidobacteraceae bacterium]
MVRLSSTDDSQSPPTVHVPREYNAAHDLLERNLLAGRGSKLAYLDDTGTYTYEELARRASRFTSALTRLGIQMEQRVLLCLLDTIDFPVSYLGCIKAGVVPIAVNTLLTPSDLEYILLDSRAVAAVVSASLLPALEPVLGRAPSLRQVLVSGSSDHRHVSLGAMLDGTPEDHEAVPTTCDDSCFWLYSSGSTGPPKGTVHAHGSLIQTAELYAKPIAGYSEDDLIFSVSKLPFAYGLGNSLIFPLAVGATAVLMAERPTARAVIERLRRYRPTVLCAVPTAFATLLAQSELPSREEMRFRICTSAGEALPEEVGKRWHARFGVHILDGIGSTEMLHIYLSNRRDEVCYGTTGRPVPGYDIRIVGEDGRPVSLGEAGELHVRGPSRALCYWNNRPRSSNTFVGEWMRTGDKYRQRDDGCYVYEGRSDDVFKVSGLYVSPAEVEAVLVGHGAVLEAAVVAKPDAEGLLKPYAYLVLKPGRSVSTRELQDHVKTRLAPYKYPRWIEFVPDLPKTATGKIQRFKLREMAANSSTPTSNH